MYILFFYGKRIENHEMGTGFFVQKRIISAVKRLEFVSDGLSYIILSPVLFNFDLKYSIRRSRKTRRD
jgi:hypothetical protein